MRFLEVGVLLTLIIAITAYTRYDGYQVLELYPSKTSDYKLLDLLRQDVQLDFWHEGYDYIHIFASPEKLMTLKQLLQDSNMAYIVRHENIQRDIDSERAGIAARALTWNSKALDYNTFNSLDDIYIELYALAARCTTGITCAVENIGLSYEGRDILGLKMSSGADHKLVWIDATTHAREWLSTTTNLNIMKHLVDDYGTDTEVENLVNTYDWFMIPVANPDGYDFSYTDTRMWRKNRAVTSNANCPGVDINRNFNQMWGNAGASTNPCDETYQGTAAGSEPETQAFQAAAEANGANIFTSLHLHTYGQLWLIPWGSINDDTTCSYAADHTDMMTVANAGANAVQDTYSTVWERGNSCDTIYPASGLTMDYFKDIGKVQYVATPELRGNNFIVSTNQIEPAYQEVWNGLVAAIEARAGLP